MIHLNHLYQKELKPDPSSPKIIETSLSVQLPDEYKKFVKTVGVIDETKLTIYGSWMRDRGYDRPSVIGYTRILRESIKLPDNYIAVESMGSDEVLLDTETGFMFCWYDDMGKILPLSEFESFEHYIKERLKEIKNDV